MCEMNCTTFKVKCNDQQTAMTQHESLVKKLTKVNLPYLTRNEVVTHDSADDCWVSFLGIVRNLTPLIHEDSESPAMSAILAFAGKDISDWFDSSTGDILHHIHPVTGVRVPYIPHGLIPDVGPPQPTSTWEPLHDTPWWFDPSFVVSYLTKNARLIRIMNVLTGEETTLEVCSEDTLERILERYLMFNSHAHSYTWKHETRGLDMNLTLDDNRVPDPRPQLSAANLSDDTYIPCIMLYYNDDLS